MAKLSITPSLELASTTEFDVVALDLMLTAHDATLDVVNGLDLVQTTI